MNMSLEYIKSPEQSQMNLIKGSSIFQTSIALKTLQNQAKSRETLQKCISRIRNFTQVKSFFQLTPQQLSVVNDTGSAYTENHPTKLLNHQESIFETLYYQTRNQTGRLRLLILEVMRKNLRKSARSIKPSNPIVIIWNLIKMFCMMHIFLVFPLIDAFQSKVDTFLQAQQYLFIFEWIFLMVDLLIRFNIQTYQDGQLITNNKQIAFIYLKSGFLLDVCGLIGFSLFLFDDQFFLRYIYFFKITEMKKFLKFLRKEIDPQNKSKNYVELLTLLFTIFLLAHIIACMWIAVSHAHSNNWLSNRNLVDEEWIVQYIWAFYFAILTMTTVGYGDIVPVNQYETIACIVIVLLSSGIFAYTLNTITTVLKDLDQEKSIYKEDARIIQNYMFKKGITQNLQRRVQKFLKLMWKKGLNDQLTQEMRVFKQLSPSLQQEINLQDKGTQFLKVGFLVNNFSIEFIKELMGCVEEVYYQPGEIIQSEGLYLLFKGSAEYCWTTPNKKIKTLCEMKIADYSGLENFFLNVNNKISVRSKDFSIFYLIKTDNFMSKLNELDFQTFCMIRDQVQTGNLENLYLTCQLCRREGHFICQDIFYKPNKQMAIAKDNVSVANPRQRFNRRQIKYQILRNYQTLQNGTNRFQKEQRAYLTAKFKSIVPSDSQEGNDVDQDEFQDSSNFCISSESWRLNTSMLEERHNSVRQIKTQKQNQHNINTPPPTNNQNVSPKVARRSIILPTNVMTFKPILRKNTQEISFSQTIKQQEERSNSVPQQQFQQQQSNTQFQLVQQNSGLAVDLNPTHGEEFTMEFDQMYQFQTYYKNYNYDQVIKRFKKNKRQLKKMKPIQN